jgi:tetratricopeptide (TPR) repeat protein
MQLNVIKRIAVIASAVLCFCAPTVTAGDEDAVTSGTRDLTSAEAVRVMDFVYQGKSRLALDYLGSLANTCGEEPFFLLVKSRVAREALTVDDENKERVEADAEPIHRDLELVIEVCSRRMEAGDDDSSLRLYRGLAWMSKAHLRSFERRFWRAGRDAKKGRSDLEKYLETNPDDPLALGTMGVFLYFADTIPSVFKYVSKLLLMPTGDREKGLRYIEFASENRNFMQTEFQVVRYTIYVLFEGRYEDGLDGTRGLLDRYPDNPRMALPIALMQPFDPANVARNVRLVDGVTDGVEEWSPGPGEPEHYALTLLDFLSVYAERFFAPPEVAESGLRRIADDNPDHPDWVGGYAAFELGRLMASLGESNEARSAFDWVGRNRPVGYIHGDAKEMAKALAGGDRSTNFPKSMWITEIYFGTRDDRTNAVEDISSSAATLQSEFYLGEALLIEGDMDAALAAYGEVLQATADPWNEEFQMLAASRVAEIHGARGDYEAASHWLGKARDYYRKEFLVDWVLEGRKRHYDRMRTDPEVSAPRLLSPPP